MSKTAYSYSIRVLSCPSCAAPIEVPTEGGTVSCRYCGSTVEITPRDEKATQILSSVTGGDISEEDRIKRLRAQDGRPKALPAELLPLFRKGEIPSWKQAEAEAHWKLLIGRLRKSPELPIAEQLFILTLKLADQIDIGSHGQKRRGLIESALEVEPLPRHRQVLLCRLASDAVVLQDQEAASRWLGLCDPRADDLTADSHYRVSRALLSTLQGRFEVVLQVLGSGDLVPILDDLEELAVLLRANAHEKLGQTDRAVELLLERLDKAGVSSRRRLKALIDSHEALHLCAASFSRAVADYGARLVKKAGVMGWSFIGIGVVAGIASFLFSVCIGGNPEEHSLVIGSGSMMAVFMLLIFVCIGLFMFLIPQKSKARLLADGLSGKAEIVEIESTEKGPVEQIETKAAISVTLPGKAAYRTNLAIQTPKGEEPPVVGDVMFVLVDPKDHSKLILES